MVLNTLASDNLKLTRMTDDPQVVVAGHICLDITPAFINKKAIPLTELFIPGRLINMGDVNISTGGSVSNTGIALQKLGIRTRLMGKIGHDLFGDCIIRLLEEQGSHEGLLIMDGEQTSYTIVIVPPGTDRMFLHNPGANDSFSSSDLNYDLIKQAALFHLGYPPLMRNLYRDEGKELSAIFKKVKDLGITTSLDMSFPDRNSESGKADWKKILENTLPYVDIFLPSYEEILYMIAPEEFEKMGGDINPHGLLENFNMDLLSRLSDEMLKMGAKIAGIKCGDKGFYARTGSLDQVANQGISRPADISNWTERELFEESYYVKKIASATGSGDASIAGFIAAYLNGLSIEETLKTACAVGAQNLAQFDALSGIKNWKETTSYLLRCKAKNKLGISNKNWKFKQEDNQWIGKNDCLFSL